MLAAAGCPQSALHLFLDEVCLECWPSFICFAITILFLATNMMGHHEQNKKNMGFNVLRTPLLLTFRDYDNRSMQNPEKLQPIERKDVF